MCVCVRERERERERERPDQPIHTPSIQPAGRTHRPPTGYARQTSDRQTSDVRQHHSLSPLGGGIIIDNIGSRSEFSNT